MKVNPRDLPRVTREEYSNIHKEDFIQPGGASMIKKSNHNRPNIPKAPTRK